MLDFFYERSTLLTLNQPLPPEPPRGNESFCFEVGQQCRATQYAALKAGTPIVITERWEQAGYCYYRGDNGMVHRTKDLAPSGLR